LVTLGVVIVVLVAELPMLDARIGVDVETFR
jgi:hypothetical protein